MSKKKIEPLSPHEEGILRATIDEAESHLQDVPPRTVKRLLALVDALRKTLRITEPLRKVAERIAKPPSLVEIFDEARRNPPPITPFEPIIAIEKFDGPLPTIPAAAKRVLEDACERIKAVHPDVDAWLHELAENANSVEMVERELIATLTRALDNAITNGLHPIDHVSTISFVENPLHNDTFFLRMTTNGEKSERIVTRAEAVNYLRLTLAARAFDLNGRTLYGAELADLIERGHLP